MGAELIAVHATRYESHAIHAKGGLQLGHLEEFVEHHASIGIALHIDYDAHTILI